MKELNYGDGYWTQGGDWGAIISALVAHFDKNVVGYHTNFPLCMRSISFVCLFFYVIANPPWSRGLWTALKGAVVFAFPSFFIPENEMVFFRRNGDFLKLLQETGYFHQQTTKPQTLGYGLNDSPAGLAAWILEKYSFILFCFSKILI
jgi:juvenile hormone epoxide hydrolase